MFLPMILGWSTGIPSRRGQGGTPIPEFGMEVLTFHLESALELVSLAVLDGVGLIGDSIGTTGTQFLTTIGTTRGAPHFTTGIIITEEEAHAADL